MSRISAFDSWAQSGDSISVVAQRRVEHELARRGRERRIPRRARAPTARRPRTVSSTDLHEQRLHRAPRRAVGLLADDAQRHPGEVRVDAPPGGAPRPCPRRGTRGRASSPRPAPRDRARSAPGSRAPTPASARVSSSSPLLRLPAEPPRDGPVEAARVALDVRAQRRRVEPVARLRRCSPSARRRPPGRAPLRAAPTASRTSFIGVAARVERRAQARGVGDLLPRRERREVPARAARRSVRREGEAVVPGAVGVGEDSTGHFADERTRRPSPASVRSVHALPRAAVARADRDLPGLVRVPRRAEREEARLLQTVRTPAVAARGRRTAMLASTKRHARLIEERVERGLHVLARRRVLRVEEVVGRGVAEAVRLEVGVEALLPGLGPGPALEHREDAPALLVGDAVERVLDVVRRHDGLADRPRAHERVGAHRALDAVGSACTSRVQLRVPRVGPPWCRARSRTPRSARCRPTRPS